MIEDVEKRQQRVRTTSNIRRMMEMITAKCLMAVLVLISLVAICSAADLPVSRVVLFSSGVGYFERAGTVEGNTEVELSFRVDQINDILKSMTLQDLGGGTIGAITYAPQDPLSHTLKSFAVDVVGNETLGELLYSLMGAKVKIVTADSTVTGAIVSVEKQEKSVGDNVMTFEVLNVLTDKGIVQVPLWHVKSIALSEQKLSADLSKALAAVAASRDLDKRTVTIALNGTGARQVHVGYLLETPVWKTSYRLLADAGKMFVQGWAIVENTTDADWENVGLSLVSGRPVSFIQNLYEPLYVARPVIQPQIAAVARPHMYDGAIEEMDKADRPMAMKEATAGAPPPPDAPPMAARTELLRRGSGSAGAYAADEVKLADAGVSAAAAGGKVGELFEYAIAQPVSVARQQSALIPIINQNIAGKKVSIYNASVNAKHPLNGIKLKNDTKLHLMGGPITVFDGGVYGGDALIGDLPPGDERLISYAVDLAVRVDAKSETSSDESAIALQIVRGVLTVTSKQVSSQTYTIKNTSAEKRTLLVEHPLRSGWKLVAPKEPAERTEDLYRFEVPVEAAKTAKLTVDEEHPLRQTIALTSAEADHVAMLVSAPKISAELKAALQKIVAMKKAIADIDRQIDEKDERLDEIGEEQDRIRKNMEQLDHKSELYISYVSKFAAQEKEFEGLQAELKKLRADKANKQKELEDYISGLDVK
jgi:hypothetical protein